MFGGNEKEEKKRAGEKRDTTTKNAIFFFYLFHRIDLESGNESDIKNRNFFFRVKPSSFIHSYDVMNDPFIRDTRDDRLYDWLNTARRGLVSEKIRVFGDRSISGRAELTFKGVDAFYGGERRGKEEAALQVGRKFIRRGINNRARVY